MAKGCKYCRNGYSLKIKGRYKDEKKYIKKRVELYIVESGALAIGLDNEKQNYQAVAYVEAKYCLNCGRKLGEK